MEDNDITTYRERFDLVEAEFFRINHDDTMIAEVYRVTQSSKQPQILKVCTRGEDYHRELYFLNHLASTLPVPHVLQVMEPEAGFNGAILMECLPGELLQTTDWSDALAYEIGSTLAQLHLNRTRNYGDLTKPHSLTPNPNIYFRKKFKEELNECAHHLPKEWIEQCRSYYDSNQHLLQSVDGPCMVHRDFRPGNMIICDGKLQGIIDWASARSGFAEQDFCSMEHRKWPRHPSHKRALLAGYASIRPVPNYHIVMPLLQLSRALAVVGFTVKSGTWNGDNARIHQFNRQFLDSFNFDS